MPTSITTTEARCPTWPPMPTPQPGQQCTIPTTSAHRYGLANRRDKPGLPVMGGHDCRGESGTWASRGMLRWMATTTLPAYTSCPLLISTTSCLAETHSRLRPGWDLVTGLGTPIANTLIPDMTGLPIKLAFTQQPTSTAAGLIDPTTGVQVAVEDGIGNTVTRNTSTVTLVLNGGSFASGGNTATARPPTVSPPSTTWSSTPWATTP